MAVAAGCLPVLGQAPPPWEFINNLPAEQTAGFAVSDYTDLLAKEGYRLLSEGDYESARAYCEYGLLRYRLSFLAHWVMWRAEQLMAEEGLEGDPEARAAEWAKLRDERPEDAVAVFQGAVADEYRGKLEAAASGYEKLLATWPDEAVLHLRLGVVLSGLGRHEDSVDQLETAVVLDEALAEAYEPLAMGCLKLQHFDAAAQAADKVLESAPESARIYYVRGVIAAAQGQRGEALRHILDGSSLERRHGAVLHWVLSAWSIGASWGPPLALWAATTVLAVAFLWMVAREAPGTADIWVAAVNLLLVLAIFSPPAAARFGSIGPSAWTQAGVMYLWAAIAFAPVMTLDAIWNAIRGASRSKESLIVGFAWPWAGVMAVQTAFAWRSEYQLSLVPIVVIPIALSLVLLRGDIVCALGVSLHRRARRYDRMIAWLRAAVRIDRRRQCRALVHAGIADAYWHLGRYEEALRENAEAMALERRPVSGVAAAQMVCVYAEMGRYEEAMGVQAPAAELCGSLGFAALPDVSQGLILLRQGQYEAAIAAARAALGKSLAPAEVKAAANAVLGYGVAMVGDFHGATEACEKASKAKNAPTWASLAEVAMGIMWSSSGHWQEAAQQFAKAVALWEANTEAHLRAAQAHAMLGQWAEAEASLNAARDAAPLSQFAPIAARLLEQGKEMWQTTQLPMPRAPAYPARQAYPPAGYPYGPPPAY